MEPILQVLDAQWLEVARSPEARRTLIRWANDNAVLAGMHDLNDVLLSRRDPSVSGEVLSILARLAPTDGLATRTLLQMLLPGLVRLVGTVGHGDPEAQDEIVALAWERIRTYPTSRNGSVAANVVLDVRKQYVKLRCGDQAVALHLVTEPVDEASSPEDQVLALLLVEYIFAAQRRGLMSVAVVDTIMRTRIGGERRQAPFLAVRPRICHRRMGGRPAGLRRPGTASWRHLRRRARDLLTVKQVSTIRISVSVPGYQTPRRRSSPPIDDERGALLSGESLSSPECRIRFGCRTTQDWEYVDHGSNDHIISIRSAHRSATRSPTGQN